MPESANRAAGIVYSATTPFTPEEYVKTLLETGTPVEVVEKFLVKKIEELDNNLRDLRENKADEAEISKVEKELKKYRVLNKVVEKRAQIESKEKELKENIEKTKKCYEDTLACADKIIDFITNLDVENLGNINERKANLHILIEGNGKNEIGFKKLLGSQFGLNKKNVEILDAIKNLKVDYKVYEEYQKLVPVFEGKTREIVKDKYKETLIKINDLEEKKKNSPFLHDQKAYDGLITELKLVNTDVLPALLTDPNEMEKIKEEVANELNLPYTPIEVPKNPAVNPEGEGKDNGEGEKGAGAENGGPVVPPAENGGDKPKPVPPLPSPDADEFKKAKQEYLSIIDSINTAIEQLNGINQEQDALAVNPEFNYQRMIDLEKDASKICTRIYDFKRILLDLEYNNYVNKHIMLNLDPEIKKAKINDADYNGDLEVFVSTHNEVIEGCYKELHQIAAQPDFATNEELKDRTNLLLKVIDAQHLIINRRLLDERRRNKDFDMIDFMKSHRVDPKKYMDEPVAKFGDNLTPPEASPANKGIDEEPIIKKVEEQLDVYKEGIIEALCHKFVLAVTPADAAFTRLEEKNIEKLFNTADANITKYIDETELSAETKQKMHEKARKVKEDTTKQFEESRIEKDKVYYDLRVALKADVEKLMSQSEELIKMSEVSISSAEYKAKRTNFHDNAYALTEKYKDLDLQISKDSVTDRIVLSIYDKYEDERIFKVLRVMSAEKEQALSKRSIIKFKQEGLNFGGKTQVTDRDKAIIDSVQTVKIALLKNSIKVEYTKNMLEDLKQLKVKLEIAASAANEGKITVTEGKESKDGEREFRYIKNPDQVTEAKLVYKDMETDEEIASFDILEYTGNAETPEEIKNIKL